jgi:hypothetical protein
LAELQRYVGDNLCPSRDRDSDLWSSGVVKGVRPLEATMRALLVIIAAMIFVVAASYAIINGLVGAPF